MKIFLRDARTELYYDETGDWVREAAGARNFETLEAAGEAALNFKDADVDVVLLHGPPLCELALNPAYCVRGPVLKSTSLAASMRSLVR